MAEEVTRVVDILAEGCRYAEEKREKSELLADLVDFVGGGISPVELSKLRDGFIEDCPFRLVEKEKVGFISGWLDDIPVLMVI